jgi:multidrug efflux system membrane fusion protein
MTRKYRDFRMRIAVFFLYVLGSISALSGCATEAQPQQQAAAPPAVPVAVGTAIRKAVPLDAGVVGTVEAYSTVSVRSQITGELTDVKFQQGDDVVEGQELFVLDRRPLEGILQQAQATLERDTAQAANAKAIMQRYEQLVERGIVAREQRDNARTSVAALEATLASDRAAVENAKVQLQYATIRAPISGRTGALMVNAGNLVRANDQAPLVTINQLTPIYVSFGLPEPMLADLRRYMARGTLRVEARPTSSDGHLAIGTVTFIDNAVDQTTGTIKVKGTFPNADRQLWPGQFVNVVVRLMTETEALVVPSLAVQTGPDGSYVYLVKPDQTVDLRPVTVARVVGADTVIKDGLAAGDTIVTDGHLRLIPGSRISVRGADAKPAP